MRTQFKTTFIGYLLSYHRRYMFTSSLSIWGFYDSLLKINVSLKCLNRDQLPAVVQLLHLKDFLVFYFPSNFCLFFPVKLIKRKTEHHLAWRYTQRLKHMKGVNTDIWGLFPTPTLEGAAVCERDWAGTSARPHPPHSASDLCWGQLTPSAPCHQCWNL